MRLALLLLVLWSSYAAASYRVYRLKITQYDRRGRVLKIYAETSSLDHLQWEHVNGGYRWARAELLDTWYCPGDTGRRAYCEKPKFGRTRGPASTLPTRSPYPFDRQPVIP